MNPKDLARLLSAMPDGADHDGDSDESAASAAPANPAALQNFFESISRNNTFQVGDIVRWKQTPYGTLKNRKLPKVEDYAVVTEVRRGEFAALDEHGAGTPYFREPQDLVLGMTDGDGDFVLYRFDSRRFERVDSPEKDRADILTNVGTLLATQNEFRPGMLVTWKPGLKNKKTPAYGEPIIVVSVLASPVIDPEKSPGSPYFREPLDVVAGEISDGDFVEFHYDGRRFQPYPAAVRNRVQAPKQR